MKEMIITEPVEMIMLPTWAASSHRAFAQQTIFIQGFPLCRLPPWEVSPFSIELDGWYFVYMTNRPKGRYTYLFEKEPTSREVCKFPIPMGYTALWVLRKTKFFHGPGYELLFRDRIGKPSEKQRISKGDYVVLQDPMLKATSNDVVFAGTRTDCMSFAEQAVESFRSSLLVAELIHDENWH